MPTHVARRVSKIGIPEIDNVIQGTIFARRKKKLFPTEDLPKVCPNLVVDIQSRKLQRRQTVSHTRSSAVSKGKSAVEDQFSRLPDEVIEFIASLLTMREGAATSVLSKRWRSLWSGSVSFYDFDLSNMTGYDHLAGNPERGERECFIKWVNRVLLTPRGGGASKIKALRVCFVLGRESASYINRWIKFTAAQGLTQLELDFSDTSYEFPCQFFASLKYLHLNACYFNYPPHYKGLNSLVSLFLERSFLSEDSLPNMLSNCSSLKCLTLAVCRFGLDKLKFSGPSLPLKHLVLRMWTPDDITKIEVHDINLVSLEFDGCDTKLSIKNTPRLARLALATATPVDILSSLPRLETLFFTSFYSTRDSILPKFYVFSNLKRLVFSANIFEAIYLLRACPLLQKLELNMNVSRPMPIDGLANMPVLIDSPTNLSTRHGTTHNNLKKVEIYGFEDDPENIEVIVYLLRNAVVLEEMKIFSITKKYHGDGEWILYERKVKQSETSMEKVWKLLKKEERPPTKLIFCPHK